MEEFLSDNYKERWTEFRDFVAKAVCPFAGQWDREQRIPPELVSALANCGYLGAIIPSRFGGKEWGFVTFGLLSEALGYGSSALADLITVQAMVSTTLLKWGTEEQRAKWLPPLARGEAIAGYALTEPDAGSDTASLATALRRQRGDSFLLTGHKKWISFGQIADLLLVFGHLDDSPVACLVERERAGVSISPIRDMLGFRAAGLAEIQFKDVEIPSANIVGKPGFALSHICPVGLHYGRISTAWSAAGLLRACFEKSIAYARERKAGHRAIGDFGMIRSLLARIGADLEAAQLICYAACRAEDAHLAKAFTQSLLAKYYCSKAVARAAADAVQIRGASGCHESHSVSRFYRDAKVMEIIEGTTQIHEHLLGTLFLGQSGKGSNR